ncbi:anthranilate phosphoribosyltransferase [Staphylococcus hominis]
MMTLTLLNRIQSHTTLSQDETTEFIKYLINQGYDIKDKVKLLQAFTNKSMDQKELTYVVKSLIHTMYPFQPKYKESICVCGTGGDKSNSFNISTTVSFVVASADIPVIKHGNKSITSNSGSTDLLKQLHIPTTKVADVSEQVSKTHLAFISAMESYPIMKYIQPIRKLIDEPTIFNIVGPLINPFKLDYQVMGVYDASKLSMIIKTMKDLGRRKGIVLHGADGMDEATLSGDNEIYELHEDGTISHYFLNARDYGIANASNIELQGGTPEENKNITVDILSGKDYSPKRDVVVLNAAIALYISNRVDSIRKGIDLAKLLIDSGKALKQCELMKGE